MLPVVHDTEASAEDDAAGGSLLDRIVRDGARQMLATVALVRAGATFYKGKLLERVEAEGRIGTEEAA